MLRLTFGKLQEDNVKAVYLTNKDENKRIFVTWYDPTTDNPHNLTPKYAITHLIEKSGYKDWEDYWNHNQKKIIKGGK